MSPSQIRWIYYLDKLKKNFHWLGSILAFIGIIFLFLRFRNYSDQIDFRKFNLITWLTIGIFIIIYTFSNTLLVFSWRSLLSYFGAATSRMWAFKTYSISQIARYIPGNIFHIAGRQVMGMADGIPSSPLAKASIWELILISIAGAVFFILILPLIIPALPIIAAVVLFIIIIIILSGLLWYYISPLITYVLISYFLFLSISGGLFVGLINLFSNFNLNNSILFEITLCGVFVLSWLVGLVTPGAPAGIGIRELILLFFLRNTIDEGSLLLAVAMGRVVTVGGDFMIFIIALLIKKPGVNSVE